jgi:hypothetical protein
MLGGTGELVSVAVKSAAMRAACGYAESPFLLIL